MKENDERTLTDFIKQWLPIIIIVALQLMVTICLPMFTFEEGQVVFEWRNPSIYDWIFTAIIELVSIATFISFTIQGKLNVKDDPRKLRGDELLGKLKTKSYKPLSPHKFEGRAYTSKGIMVTVSSLGTCILIPLIALSFNIATFIVLLFNGLTSTAMGILNMKRFEDYYTHEYIDYANWRVKREAELESDAANKEAEE